MHDLRGRTVISYMRFSSTKQKLGDSERRQIEAITDFVNKAGAALDETLSMSDPALSAFKSEHISKGELGVFFEALKEKEIILPTNPKHVLMIEKLDRLTRLSLKDGRRLIEDLLEYVDIYELGYNKLYTEEAADDLATALVLAVRIDAAHQYSKNLSDRLLATWDNKYRTQKHTSNKTPYWLQRTSTGYELIEDRAIIVRRIFNEYAKGNSPRSIAQGLNADNILHFKNGSWNQTKIKNIINSYSVTGDIKSQSRTKDLKRANKEEADLIISDVYPQVISHELFDKCQVPRMQREFGAGKKAAYNENLFEGIIKCNECGSTYTYHKKGRYICSNRDTGGTCSNGSIEVKAVEEAISKSLFLHLRNEGVFNTEKDTTLIDQLSLKISKKEKALKQLTEYAETLEEEDVTITISISKHKNEIKELTKEIDLLSQSETEVLDLNWSEVANGDEEIRVKAKKIYLRLLQSLRVHKYNGRSKQPYFLLYELQDREWMIRIEQQKQERKEFIGGSEKQVLEYYTMPVITHETLEQNIERSSILKHLVNAATSAQEELNA
ncbi:recombinase family protein [Vibrio sp. SM6]|uniref:Recombinase family protein n=1 Tax=Vibrio agarilyticus TaxID=2726741 RepID=A0A7X8TQR3_9VIBR|nr:recombinase family protein [Vibrio agarilyticus]NLS13020.1 recombinase family protein [Vibrio agarilyticus]